VRRAFEAVGLAVYYLGVLPSGLLARLADKVFGSA